MSTKKIETNGSKSKNSARNQLSPSKDSSHEKVWEERNQLREEVAQKNEEIEKLTAAILSAREHLSKAIECLQKVPTAYASATTNGQHTDSPKTPKQDPKPARNLGRKNVLRRTATDVTDHEQSASDRPLKRSHRSAPEKSTFPNYCA